MRMLVALGVAVAAVALGAHAVDATVTLPEYAKQGELWQRIQAQSQMLFQAPSAELWFTQQVDHFADNSSVLPTNATFQQRYYEVNTFWRQPDGPVILYIGGEGALTAAPGGFVNVLAQKFGAKILALEHRFYGQSIPNGNLETANYRFLTVQQALADLAHFRTTYEQQQLTSLRRSPTKWLVIGGSYPGALAAWFRIAYPNATTAALSSSGVVDPVYTFDAFDKHVALAAGETCATVLRHTTSAFEQQIASGNATRVKRLLNAEALADADFFYMLADAAAMAVQYGHKDVLCTHMERTTQPLTEAFANFTIAMYGASFGSGCFYDTQCLVHDRARWSDGRSWRWQKCAQLAYFQVAPPTQSLRSAIVNVTYHEQQCRTIFGDAVDTKAGVNEIAKLFGGAHPQGHNIFFSNGGDDPWQRASVVTSLAADEVADVAQCDLCGHCGDLRAADAQTPAPLRKQREEIVKYLTKWLDAASDDVNVDAVVIDSVQTDTVDDEATTHRYRSSPLVLVPIAFAFVALVAVLHKDVVRDARTARMGYERLTGV